MIPLLLKTEFQIKHLSNDQNPHIFQIILVVEDLGIFIVAYEIMIWLDRIVIHPKKKSTNKGASISVQQELIPPKKLAPER